MKKILVFIATITLFFSLLTFAQETVKYDPPAPKWLNGLILSDYASIRKALKISDDVALNLVTLHDENNEKNLEEECFVEFLLNVVLQLEQISSDFTTSGSGDSVSKIEFGSTTLLYKVVAKDESRKILIVNEKLPVSREMEIGKISMEDAAVLFSAMYAACPQFFNTIKTEYKLIQNVSRTEGKSKVKERYKIGHILYSFNKEQYKNFIKAYVAQKLDKETDEDIKIITIKTMNNVLAAIDKN